MHQAHGAPTQAPYPFRADTKPRAAYPEGLTHLPTAPAAIDGIPQHPQSIASDCEVLCLDCGGSVWTVQAETTEDRAILAVKVGSRWMHAVEVLNDLTMAALHKALDARDGEERDSAVQQ